MEVEDIKELINFFEGTKLSYFEIVDNNKKITFRKDNNPAANDGFTENSENSYEVMRQFCDNQPEGMNTEKSKAINVEENLHIVKSPFVGIITLPEHIKNSGKEVIVNKGEVLCTVEAMKLYNDITSPVNGIVVEVLAEEASLVEYDQPIMKIRIEQGEECG